jgi:hypothetical protein
MRLSFAAALFGAALIVAPSASAQGAPALLTTVGTPFPYRIDLPGDCEIVRDSRTVSNREVHSLTAGRQDLVVVVQAVDLMEGDTRRAPGISEAQMRRIMTDMVVKSDSLLHGIMQSASALMSKSGEIRDPVREIRTLAGQRAAYMSGRVESDGMLLRFEMHLTVQDGIMYVLMTMAPSKRYAAHGPLFARIRESLVLGPTAPGFREGDLREAR